MTVFRSVPGPSRKLRIAALNLTHETVTFLGNDTTLEDFVYGMPGSQLERARIQAPPSTA